VGGVGCGRGAIYGPGGPGARDTQEGGGCKLLLIS